MRRKWGQSQAAWFVRQETLSCLFPGVLFLTFGVTRWIVRDLPDGVYRYDLILFVCLLAQWGMVRTGLESRDEVKVIAVFHVLGLLLELFKTHARCWSYPEKGLTKFHGVPLFSGFMYASVASYLCQAWRRLTVRLVEWPPTRLIVPLVFAIYLNFFTEHVLPDARWLLVAVILVLFRRTRVEFRVDGAPGSMPMSLAFLLIGSAVWVAENIATRLGAWQYPDQHGGWHWVHYQKISSWSLLVILTFLIVAQLKHFKAGHHEARREPVPAPASSARHHRAPASSTGCSQIDGVLGPSLPRPAAAFDVSEQEQERDRARGSEG